MELSDSLYSSWGWSLLLYPNRVKESMWLRSEFRGRCLQLFVPHVLALQNEEPVSSDVVFFASDSTKLFTVFPLPQSPLAVQVLRQETLVQLRYLSQDRRQVVTFKVGTIYSSITAILTFVHAFYRCHGTSEPLRHRQKHAHPSSISIFIILLETIPMIGLASPQVSYSLQRFLCGDADCAEAKPWPFVIPLKR